MTPDTERGVAQTQLFIFDEVRVKFCAKHELDAEELALIQRYLPQHNVRMKREAPKVDLSGEAFFKELLANGPKPPGLKRRYLPKRVRDTELYFRRTRDKRERVTLAKVGEGDANAA